MLRPSLPECLLMTCFWHTRSCKIDHRWQDRGQGRGGHTAWKFMWLLKVKDSLEDSTRPPATLANCSLFEDTGFWYLSLWSYVWCRWLWLRKWEYPCSQLTHVLFLLVTLSSRNIAQEPHISLFKLLCFPVLPSLLFHSLGKAWNSHFSIVPSITECLQI